MVPGLRRARPELLQTENERTARSCLCADIQPSPGGRAVLPEETSSPRARAPTPPPRLMRESHQLLKFRSKSSQRRSGVSSSVALATSPELSTRGGKADVAPEPRQGAFPPPGKLSGLCWGDSCVPGRAGQAVGDRPGGGGSAHGGQGTPKVKLDPDLLCVGANHTQESRRKAEQKRRKHQSGASLPQRPR